MDKDRVVEGFTRDKNGLIEQNEDWKQRMRNANNGADKKKFIPVRDQKRKLEKPRE